MNQRGPVPLNHGESLLACILEAVGNKRDAQKFADGLKKAGCFQKSGLC